MSADAEGMVALELSDGARDTLYISDPLAYLRRVQTRRRGLLTLLARLVESAGAEPAGAALLLRYFQHEVMVLDADEWEDLIPLLRRRCGAEESMGELLERLADDHAASRAVLNRVCALLLRLSDGSDPPTEEERLVLHDFAERERRTLTLENAVVLPLARVRLTKSDLRSLALRMATRRGLCLVPPRPES